MGRERDEKKKIEEIAQSEDVAINSLDDTRNIVIPIDSRSEERSMSHDFRLFFSGDVCIRIYKDDRVIDSGRVVVDGDTYEARGILNSRGQRKRGRDSWRNNG